MINLTIYTGLFWPIRCTLSIACSSTAGFHQGSIRNTLLAATKLRPTPAVFKETRKICTFGSYWNDLTILVRYLWVLLPSIRTYLNLFFLIYYSSKSSIPKNWLKMTTLSSGFSWSICSLSAIIFVLKNVSYLSLPFFKFNLFSLGRYIKSSFPNTLLQNPQEPFS